MFHPRSRTSALLACAVLGLAACGTAHATKSPMPRPTATPIATPTGTPVPTPVPTPAPLNAPLLIQVENLYQARPQSGLSTADVVYEYQTEGGISRFTGIWFTRPPTSDLVGPVRSARLIDLRLLQIYGGALLFSGASNYTLAQLNSSGLKAYSPDNAVVGSTILYRTSSPPPAARYGAPHDLYTNGTELASFAQKVGLTTVGYQLWPRTTSRRPSRRGRGGDQLQGADLGRRRPRSSPTSRPPGSTSAASRPPPSTRGPVFWTMLTPTRRGTSPTSS